MKNQPLKYNLNVVGLSIILFLCIRTYIPPLLQSLGFASNLSVWLIVCAIILIISCIGPSMLIEQMSSIHLKLFKKPRIVLTFALVSFSMLLLLGVSVINQLFINIFSGVFNITVEAHALLEITSIFEFILYFIYISIIPAIFEELFLRGYVLNLLSPYNKRFAIILSSFLFMLMHQNISSFLPIFVAAVLMACIYFTTGSIWGCIALHFINNTYSFLMIFTNQYIGGVSAMSFGIFLNALILVCGSFGYFYLKSNKVPMFVSLKKQKDDINNYKTILKSPVMLIAIVACVFGIVEYTIRYFGK